MVEFLTNNIFIYICLQIEYFKLAYKVAIANTVFFYLNMKLPLRKPIPQHG